MTSEQNKYLEERLAEFEQSLIDNPIIPKTPVVDTQREKVHVRYNVPDSTYNLEETEGHTTYEVVGHFNPDASENLLQKIFRMMKEEKVYNDTQTLSL